MREFPSHAERLPLLQQRYSPAFFASLKGLKWPAAWQSPSGMAGGNWQQREDGQSMAFKHHRPYVEGDDARQTDWALYARTRKLYTRVHYEERLPELLLLLDNSTSMMAPDWEADYLRLLDHTVALAWLALEAGFQVRCVPVANDSVATVPAEGFMWRTTRALSRHGVAHLAAIEPQGQLSPQTIAEQAHRWRHRDCLVMLVSDCQIDVTDLDKTPSPDFGIQREGLELVSSKAALRMQQSVHTLHAALKHYALPQYRVCLCIVQQPMPTPTSELKDATKQTGFKAWRLRRAARRRQRALLLDAESDAHLLVKLSDKFISRAQQHQDMHLRLLQQMAIQHGMQSAVWTLSADWPQSLHTVLNSVTPLRSANIAWSGSQ